MKEDWEKIGMLNFLQLATTDIFEAPSVEKLTEGKNKLSTLHTEVFITQWYIKSPKSRNRLFPSIQNQNS